MTGPVPSFWQKSYVALGAATFLLGMLHFADDFFRGEVTMGSPEVSALGSLVVGVIFVFGLLWSWRYRSYGYWVVLVLSVVGSLWGPFLTHALGISPSPSLTEMVSKAGAWAPVMVAISLLVGVSSVSTAILAIYLLANPAARRA